MTIEKSSRTGPRLVIAALGIAIAAGLLISVLLRQANDDSPDRSTRTGADDGIIGDPYPPPASPLATPSPPADSSGVLAPPDGVVTDTTTIGESPWSGMLSLLDAAIAAEDSEVLSTYLPPGSYGPARISADASGVLLSAADAQAVFDQLFQNGSSPQLQGYFAPFMGAECFRVVSSGWIGPAYLPTPKFPPPTETPERPPFDPPNPPAEKLNGDTFVWRVCDWGSGAPVITDWSEGAFHHIVASRYQASLAGADPAWFKYTIIIP